MSETRSIPVRNPKPDAKKHVLRYLLVHLIICIAVFLMGVGATFADTYLTSRAPLLSSKSCWVDNVQGEYLTTFVNVGEEAGELGYSQKLNPNAIVSLGVMSSGESRLERLYGSELIYHWRKSADVWRFQGTFEAIDRSIDNDCRIHRGQRVPTAPSEFVPDEAQAECSLPIDRMTRQITLAVDSPLYYSPDENATTGLTLEAGKQVWLMSEYDHGFQKVWFACQELWIVR